MAGNGRAGERETEPLEPAAAAVMVDVAREMTFCTERRTPTLGSFVEGRGTRSVAKKCVCPEFLTSRITNRGPLFSHITRHIARPPASVILLAIPPPSCRRVLPLQGVIFIPRPFRRHSTLQLDYQRYKKIIDLDLKYRDHLIDPDLLHNLDHYW